MRTRLLLLFASSALLTVANGQLVVNNTLTPTQLVQNVLLGSGVTVTNITFNGLPGTSLTEQMGDFDANATVLGMGLGVIMATGDVNNALGPNTSGSNSLGGGNFGQSDPDLEILSSPQVVNDAAVLEFDFVPNGDTLKFDFIFASDEYPEYVCGVNDVFGFFLSGPGFSGPFSNGAENIALIPGTSIPISINTVNNGFVGANGTLSNCVASSAQWNQQAAYYVDNGNGSNAPYNSNPIYVQYDGYTTVLTAFALVTCGLQYHIKIAVGDASDTVFDSAVFLKAGSFTSTAAVNASLSTAVGLIDSTLYEGCATAVLSFERYAGFATTDTVQLSVGGTATAGVDYFPVLPSEIVFLPGDTTVSFILTAPLDVDLLETVDITISNVAQCSGMLVVTNFTFYINEAQPMYIAVSDTAIACDQMVTIGPDVFQGYGNYQYTWNTGDTTATITVSPPVTTTYSVTVTDTCGQIPQTGNITVNVPAYAPVQMTVTNDTALSCPQAAVLQVISTTGGDGNYSYEWTDGNGTVLSTTTSLAINSGPLATYYITVEAGCGMGDADTIVVSPLALPPIVVQTNNDTIVQCPGDSLDLVIASLTGGSGVYTLAWSDGFSVLSTNDTIYDVGVIGTATYYIAVLDQCGNTGFDSVTVQLPVWDPYTLWVAPDTAICLGTEGQLSALASGGAGGYQYVWSPIGGTARDMTIAPTDPGTYTMTVTDACGYVLSDDMFMDVQFVVADFSVNYIGEFDVTFLNQSSNNTTEWFWDFDDGATDSAQFTAHRYLSTDDHDVWLWVWNPIGCVDSTKLVVQPPSHVYVPNSFTPDGDGINDGFAPVGHDLSEYEFNIFDRWGQVIFASRNPGEVWDGKVGGAEPKQDVYVWKLRTSGRRFGPVEYLGSVTLIR
ncbi:MAG: choice-of-anchor L domain-containing protein [Flavobacteriales bacterium]